MTLNTASVKKALNNLDLDGLAVFDFGCGNGNLLRVLKETKADTIYAFEVMPENIDGDILAWANDHAMKPRLVLNPAPFKIDPAIPDGDMTGYNYFRLLENHRQFAIVSNPPYFLYNRILSLTGVNLAPEDRHFETFSAKFAGALMITSRGRLHNHPGWHVLDLISGSDFNPPACGTQYLIQTGFDGRNGIDRMDQPVIHGMPQRYPAINNRDPGADMTDFYPEMWQQLNRLGQKSPMREKHI